MNDRNSFDRALDFTLKWEGNAALSNDPDDPGGSTRYGISYRFLKNLPFRDADINADGVINWKDIKDLTLTKARSLYERYFWRRLMCDLIPDRLAITLFDTAVNVGRSRTAKWLQRLVSAKRDGYVGPKTLQAGAEVGWRRLPTEKLICNALLDRRRLHYYMLANEHEWAEKFINGWTNRINDLERELKIV